MPRLIANEHMDYYRARGVPGGVLHGSAPENIKDHFISIKYEINGKPVRITQEDQRSYFIKMKESEKPFLSVISGQTDDTLAAQAALLACADMISDDASKKFYWHTLTGSFKDRVRDDDVLADDVSRSNLLIISNIAVNSTTIKIEKLRDILELYSHIPRIVVVSGSDPIDFCSKILYAKPRFAIYFGR